MNLFIPYIFCIGLWVFVAFGQPTNRNEDEWFKEQWPTQPYAFGYEIRDYNGNEQYRKEMSDGDRVTGSYGYLGPDGVFRHVDYTADENGFRAKIRTSEPGTANENPSNVEIESNPVRVTQNPPQGVSSGVTPDIDPGNVPMSPTPSGEGLRGDGLRPPDRIRGDGLRPPDRIRGDGLRPPDRTRGDGLRPPDRTRIRDNPDRNNFGDNPNRSTYGNRPPTRPSLPRIPDQSSRTKPPLPIIRNIPNINRESDPNTDPNILRGGDRTRNRDRTNFGDMPDNIVPYRGANPKRPALDSSRGGAGQNEFDNRNFGSGFRGNQDVDNPRDPNFNRNRIRPSLPSLPSPLPAPSPPRPQSFDRNYERDDDRSVRKQNIPNRNTIFDDNRGSTADGPNRGHDIQKGDPKRPTNFGFIEATKGPINKPIGGFYGNKGPPSLFDDDRDDDYDELKRRQDDDRSNISDDPKLRRISPINRPVFEDRESPQRNTGINRSRYDTTIDDRQDGQKTKGPSNRDSPLFNRSSFGVNEDKLDIDNRDKRVRRPTKVFVTNGPIFMNDDKRFESNANRGDDRSYGPEEQQQQQIDVDYDDKTINDDRFIKDPYEQSFDGPKGRPDRNRPLRPIQKEQKPTQGLDPKLLDEKPYFVGRQPNEGKKTPIIVMRKVSSPPKDRSQDKPFKPEKPLPPYRPRVEQKHIHSSDDNDEHPVQRDDEFPPEQPLRPIKPQIYQPLRPDRPQISQPVPPRTPSSYDSNTQQRNPQRNEYKPRTQSYDRTYVDVVEQKHIDIQPYQTQNSATISTPTNSIPTLYKPIQLPNTPESTEKDSKEKPAKEPLSPSLYIVTPFPASTTESSLDIKPKLGAHTFPPEITQMQIPKFGTRIQTESPSTTEITNEGQFQQVIDSNENKDSNTDNLEDNQYYDEEQNQDEEQKQSNSKNFSYSQSISQSSNENININTSTSSPTQVSHEVLNVINWQKYDHFDDSNWK